MKLRAITATTATAALAGGLLLTGAPAASASTWKCPSGATCGYHHGSVNAAWKAYANVNDPGSANKVRNNGTSDPNGLVNVKVTYTWTEPHDPNGHKATKCLKPGEQEFLRGDYKDAQVTKVRWTSAAC